MMETDAADTKDKDAFAEAWMTFRAERLDAAEMPQVF